MAPDHEGNAVLRPALLILALWAVIAAPAMCAAGVLAHECECADGAVCDHESDCDVDPCGEQLFRRDGRAGASLAGPDPGTPSTLLAPAMVLSLPATSHATPRAPSPPTPPLGVRHASDLPLLI